VVEHGVVVFYGFSPPAVRSGTMKAHKVLKDKSITAQGEVTPNEYLCIQAVGADGCKQVFS